MKNCKIELEVTNPQGISKLFACDLDTQKVFVGVSGKPTSILCPWLADFEASYVALDTFTGHIGTFEIVHYCFVEGCIASETIQDDDDNVLASYQILIDGKPTTYDEFQTLKA